MVARAIQGAAPHGITERGQGKAVILVFTEDAKACQRAHQPVERRPVAASRPGQVGGALRPIREVIGQAELCGGAHRPRHPIARCHLNQLSVRWHHVDSSLDVSVHMANLLSPQ
jgi:hypothetical protein